MKRKFAVFDIDGTFYRWSLFMELVNQLNSDHKLPKKLSENILIAKEKWRNREHETAYLDFMNELVVDFHSQLTLIKPSDIDTAAGKIIANKKHRTHVYPKLLLERLKKEEYFLIAISGSQIELIKPFADYYGFDAVVAQTYERDGDTYSGVIHSTHSHKEVFLKELIKEHHLTKTDSIAIGDSNGDVGLLEFVENPIAFNPDKKLYDKAKLEHWKIVIERKNVMYELEHNNVNYILA